MLGTKYLSRELLVVCLSSLWSVINDVDCGISIFYKRLDDITSSNPPRLSQ